MKSAYSVEYADKERRVGLRDEIESALPSEEVKLRHGPFDGVTAKIKSGEARIIVTQSSFSTSQIPPPVIAFEYQRDSKPQFSCVGHKEFNPADLDAESVASVDESDFREGFFRGLHRAASLLLVEGKRHSEGKDWQSERVCYDMVDKLREVANAMGFHRQDLYSLYPGDEQEYDKQEYRAKAARK